MINTCRKCGTEWDAPVSACPTCNQERFDLQREQAARVMPLIGSLLDVWATESEGSQEEWLAHYSKLDRAIADINRAMTGEPLPASAPECGPSTCGMDSRIEIRDLEDSIAVQVGDGASLYLDFNEIMNLANALTSYVETRLARPTEA